MAQSAPKSGQVVDYEAKALYLELWRERHPSFDRVTTWDGPTDCRADRQALPDQIYWHHGSIVKVVTGAGSQYLFDDELDAEYLNYIVGDDGNLVDSYLSFEDWLKLVKCPAPENEHLKLESSSPESSISAPMSTPLSGIDVEIEGVDDVLGQAGRVEHRVL